MCICACVIVCLCALGSRLMTVMMTLLMTKWTESLKPPTPQRLLVQNQFLSRCLLNGIINSLNVKLS